MYSNSLKNQISNIYEGNTKTLQQSQPIRSLVAFKHYINVSKISKSKGDPQIVDPLTQSVYEKNDDKIYLKEITDQMTDQTQSIQNLKTLKRAMPEEYT